MCLRYLKHIEGLTGHFNNIIFKAGEQVNTQNKWSIVCYFGGDIQNFRQEMINANYEEYLDYSLESVASQLSQTFTQDDIIVIQPSNLIQGFSIYNNFVRTIDNLGTPSFDYQNRSCYDHLINLLVNVYQKVNSDKIGSKSIEAKVIAFSKGQIVVNQLAHSLSLPNCNDTRQLKLLDLYFLDGGHNGKNNIWITDPKLIDALIINAECRRFHIGITDFQLKKFNIIQYEVDRFQDILASRKDDKNLNIKLTYLCQKQYKELPLIKLHFKLLDYLFQNKL